MYEDCIVKSVCLKGSKALSKCFLSFPEAKTYHEASDACISQGGTLSSPENGDENDALYDYVRKSLGSGSEVWIGINDMANEGSWVDMTGSRISFKHWETEITTQPDGGKQENCASLSAVAIEPRLQHQGLPKLLHHVPGVPRSTEDRPKLRHSTERR
ncbi:unnamed protein product [Ranitomeya imitator]|uniref:C-type lectin domain-containing protein n=1 Tax=Ranitomeya imitator TaxID=111125 RepID=A0ABN9MI10_9NEOB|nr:unnamed protein product [Ranitomeya imitator]